eukprot:superscaffoldBa00001768_g11934
MDFLTNRSQRVLVNNTFSILLHTSTSSPQGCVLSPLLFILHADDCRSIQPNCHMAKFADNTVLLPLCSGPSHHHSSALEFVEWCDNSCLELYVNKTMVVTFSNKQRGLAAAVITTIHGKPIQEYKIRANFNRLSKIVSRYLYLGTTFNNNTEEILRQC